MKRQKIAFNNLLIKYNKYVKKLERLQLTGKNLHRQNVLIKHIEELRIKLYGLFNNIKKTASIGTVTASMILFASEVDAQISFASAQQNPFGLVNVGQVSAPTFADIDGDGDLDLLASIFITETSDEYTRLYYFENTGDFENPNFGVPQVNPFGLTLDEELHEPTFKDLDGDGELDLLSGDFGVYNSFHYYENIGDFENPSFGARQTDPFGLTPGVVESVLPTLVDLDGDGDFDMVSGGEFPNFYYYENIGDFENPSFGGVQTNPFGLTSVGTYFSSPTFADIDEDGDFDLLAGVYYGGFYYFENTGDFENPNFGAPQFNPFGLTNVGDYYNSPTFADIDGDGDFDMIAGEGDGNFYYFENTSTVLGVERYNLLTVNLYPNPATNILTIDSEIPLTKVEIYSILGKKVKEINSDFNSIPTHNLSNGVYHIRMHSENGIATKKMIKK